jgi:hypothetical protein
MSPPTNGTPPPVVQRIVLTLTLDGKINLQVANPQIDAAMVLAMLSFAGNQLAHASRQQGETKPVLLVATGVMPK